MPLRKNIVSPPLALKSAYHESKETEDDSRLEIGIDEAGRGPLFGRVYVASVILPKGYSNPDIKDSKQIKSKHKMKEIANTIKQNAIAWSVKYVEHDVIDEINIRQAVFRGMHASIRETTSNVQSRNDSEPIIEPKTFFLMVDGNDFKPYMVYDEDTGLYDSIPHVTIEGGDHLYQSIAAASILAKSERDSYISSLCEHYPELSERYGIDHNMGYGTKRHIEGITEWGITQWHRKSYARCNMAKWNPI